MFKGLKNKLNRKTIFLIIANILIALVVTGIIDRNISQIIIGIILLTILILIPFIFTLFARTNDGWKKILKRAVFLVLMLIAAGIFFIVTITYVFPDTIGLFRSLICPVGFTKIKPYTVSSTSSDREGKKNTYEYLCATCSNDTHSYDIDEFKVMAGFLFIYLTISFLMLGTGFLFHTLFPAVAGTPKYFIIIASIYLFLLLLLVIPTPVASFIQQGFHHLFNRGYTPLFYNAIEDSNTTMLDELLRKGASVNARTGYDKTLLHIAVEKENEEMTRFLLERGADINARDRDGMTVLMTAGSNHFTEIFKVLLECKPDLKIKNNRGKTVFDILKEKENIDILDLLNNYNSGKKG